MPRAGRAYADLAREEAGEHEPTEPPADPSDAMGDEHPREVGMDKADAAAARTELVEPCSEPSVGTPPRVAGSLRPRRG